MVKIERNSTPPPSLARKTTYNEKDVVDQLVYDSGNKCYICEMHPSDPEIEHLLPHENGKYIDREFDWNNLFYVCRHCNMVKNNKKYYGKIIDCCKEDPEEHIDHIINNNHVIVQPHDSSESREDIKMTAELIQNCFENDSKPLRQQAAQTRFRNLSSKMNILYDLLLKLKSDESPNGEHIVILKEMLSRKSEFAAFTRFYIRDHAEDYPELQEFCNQ